jgi:antibiotic biosynthesis monooxygenase (ABM) superfamily enzyme
MAETTITTPSPTATLINVFVVEPDRQRELVDLLERATTEVMRYLPGFVSANIHASDDGARVVNYAQWATPAAYQAMLRHPVAQEHMRKAAVVAISFDPHLYTVESVHHR